MSKEADASRSPRNTAAWAVSASQGAELRQMCTLRTRWGGWRRDGDGYVMVAAMQRCTRCTGGAYVWRDRWDMIKECVFLGADLPPPGEYLPSLCVRARRARHGT